MSPKKFATNVMTLAKPAILLLQKASVVQNVGATWKPKPGSVVTRIGFAH